MSFAKIGSQLLVNTTSVLDQYQNAAVRLSDGRFLITWSDDSETGGDTSEAAVRGQIFTANGTKSGGEFLINTATFDNQSLSAASALANGQFVVTWRDSSGSGNDTSISAVRGQIFAFDGTRSGGEFLINTTTVGAQEEPSVATLADGRFVVTWADQSATGGDPSLTAVRGQIFTANGVKTGGEFLVNTTTFDDQNRSSVAALPGGGFVVTFTDFSRTGGDTSSFAVRGQVFGANGIKSGGEFLVNSTTLSSQASSSTTVLADGRFIVTWSDLSQSGGDTSGYAVRGQIFTADGVKNGGEFLVNTTTSANQVDSSVTALADGRFVVTWSDQSFTHGDNNGSSIHAQVFAADGSKSGVEFLVNTLTAGDQFESSVSALSDGSFVVSWTDASKAGGDTSGTSIAAQLFDATTYLGDATGETVIGGTLTDTISGFAGNDLLFGRGGNDTLNGGDNNDMLNGGVGADVLNGGNGFDFARYDDSTAGVTARLDGGVGAGDAAGDTFNSIEGIVGSAFVDTLIGDGNANTLNGNNGSDTLSGGDGSDTLNGGSGTDTMYGGSGNDTYVIDNANDVADESEVNSTGIDTTRSSVISINLGDTVHFKGSIEQVAVDGILALNATGNGLNNYLQGNFAANRLDGGVGTDTMKGLGGNDTYIVDNAGDIVDESAAGSTGVDTVRSSVISIQLFDTAHYKGAIEQAALDGALALSAVGNGLNNYLQGNGAANGLNGGLGNDIMKGNGGADRFYFNTALNAATNVDTINDFAVDDTIYLTKAIFSGITATGTLAATAFANNTTGVAGDATDRIIYETDTGKLFYDADGLGGAGGTLFAILPTGLALTNADFMVT